jgi:tetratricopeptide (TPR) repeat protein
MAGLHLWTKDSAEEALTHFYGAIDLDPSFAAAYGMAARCFCQRRANGWMRDRLQESAETVRLARLAIELGREDAVALIGAGFSLAYVAGDVEEGDALIEQGLVLNPNLAWAWYISGWVKIYRGEPQIAIDRATRAMRLSPYDTHRFNSCRSSPSVICYQADLQRQYQQQKWRCGSVRPTSLHGAHWQQAAPFVGA